MGRSVPPYIIQDSNAGAEFEIIDSALSAVGHTLKPVYFPLARVEQMLLEHKVDGTTPLKRRDDHALCFSDSHIQYQNVAIALTSRNYDIQSLKDLRGKRLIAFQKAKRYLGEEFASIVSNSPDYHEYPDQNKQVHDLFGGTTDVIIADKNIFRYYYEHSIRKNEFGDYTVFPIFPPSNYSVGFIDPELCEDFNRGLDIIKKESIYETIKDKYLLAD